jgi:hypothetical protein
VEGVHGDSCIAAAVVVGVLSFSKSLSFGYTEMLVVTVHCLDDNSMDSKARHSLDSKISNFTHDIAWTT